MNCQRVRRLLLAAQRPEPPPVELRPHLGGCVDCRAWLRRLGTMERQLTLLPVPASEGKERLLRRLREISSDCAPSLPSQVMPLPARLKERGLRKLSVAFALAATIAAFAVGLSLWPTRTPAPPHSNTAASVAAWEAQRLQRLAKAGTPRDQVKSLSDFAVHLQIEAADLSRKAEGDLLLALADFYDTLICQHLVETARAVPGDQREAVFRDVRSMLGRAESEMERLASEAGPRAKPLRQIASAAREGDRRLQALMLGTGS